MATPRCAPGNQLSTARPLAALTLAPDAPARNSQPASTPAWVATEAAASASPAPSRPADMTSRSPTRSVSRPQSSSVRTSPAVGAPSSAPNEATDSPWDNRSASATAASPWK